MKRLIASLLLLSGLAIAPVSSATFDTIIRGGRVVDGTGNPARFAEIGIKAGKIVSIGRITGNSKSVIDATGMIVAPGFIDVHTHADEIVEHPCAENFLRMGVTTLVIMLGSSWALPASIRALPNAYPWA